MGVGALCKTGPDCLEVGAISSSTKVCHSPQDGHLPSHLGDLWPQLLQKNALFPFFSISIGLLNGNGGSFLGGSSIQVKRKIACTGGEISGKHTTLSFMEEA